MQRRLPATGSNPRRIGAFMMAVGLIAVVFSVIAPAASATDHPDHCGTATSSTQATGVTDPGNGNNPAGNNGTVKIDGCELDQGRGPDNDKPGNGDPDNEPHIGCLVTVDWYGYDADPGGDDPDLYSSVQFEVWPPTGGKVDITVPVVDHRTPGNGHAAFEGAGPFTSDNRVYIGEDAASGGNPDGIDASVTYRMDQVLASFEAHPQHGWHVKLTINADGSQGADVKHKVFWTGPCEAPTTTTSSTSTSSTSTSSTSTSTTSSTTSTSTSTTSTTTPGGGVTTTTPGGSTFTPTTTTPAPTTTEAVLGTQFEQTTTSTAAPAVAPAAVDTTPRVMGVQLARTGQDTRTFLFVAGLALLLGGAAIAASQRFGPERAGRD